MRGRLILAFVMLAVSPTAAFAGPPFDTDDPDPTETGHWENYLGNTLDWSGSGHEGEFAAEVNYGAAPNLQLSLALPYDYASGAGAGAGDVEFSIKYRFFNDEHSGVSVATFPAVALPTGARAFSANHLVTTVPVWGQVKRGKWTLFGGGGYVINPGREARNYWIGGVALLRQASEKLTLGAEVTREGPAEHGERASTGVGVGMIYRINGPFSSCCVAGQF